jgi:hypothetical protein
MYKELAYKGKPLDWNAQASVIRLSLILFVGNTDLVCSDDHPIDAPNA